MNSKSLRRCSLPFLFPVLLAGLVLLFTVFAGFCVGGALYETTFDMSIADAYEDDEMSMESEISRRLLAGTHQYITPAALKKDARPCHGPGKPNGGCLPPRSNPNSQPCLKIYRSKC